MRTLVAAAFWLAAVGAISALAAFYGRGWRRAAEALRERDTTGDDAVAEVQDGWMPPVRPAVLAGTSGSTARA